jgi:hypothetical protein
MLMKKLSYLSEPRTKLLGRDLRKHATLNSYIAHHGEPKGNHYLLRVDKVTSNLFPTRQEPKVLF